MTNLNQNPAIHSKDAGQSQERLPVEVDVVDIEIYAKENRPIPPAKNT